jgi:hypothetical protein
MRAKTGTDATAVMVDVKLLICRETSRPDLVTPCLFPSGTFEPSRENETPRRTGALMAA